jgi:hypothetical protein
VRPLRVHGLGEMSFDPVLIPGGVTGAQVEFETRGFTEGLAHNMVIEKSCDGGIVWLPAGGSEKLENFPITLECPATASVEPGNIGRMLRGRSIVIDASTALLGIKVVLQ